MRVKILMVLFCLSVLLMPSVFSASSVVEMELEESLSESDIGILAGDVSPNGESVLVVGEDGYARKFRL